MPPSLADIIRRWLDRKGGCIPILPTTPRIQGGGYDQTCGAEMSAMEQAQIKIALLDALLERVATADELSAYTAFVDWRKMDGKKRIGINGEETWKNAADILHVGKRQLQKRIYGDGDKKGIEENLRKFMSEKLGRVIG